MVENVMALVPINIGFRKPLSGNKRERWQHLVHLIDNDDFFDED
jgi:hypothetical protein